MAKIFLSSARSNDLVLGEVRDELKVWAENSRVNLWQFEKYAESYWNSIGFPRSAAACLSEVDRCDLYVAIFHGAYGGSANQHAASVALTDLEFFEAVREGKQIRFYIIEPHDPGPELKALLTLVRTLVPKSFGGSGTAAHILSIIKDDIARHLGRRDLWAPWRIRIFQKYKSAVVDLRREELDSIDGLQVLPQNVRPGSAHGSVDVLENALKSANLIADPGQRESQLSALLPELVKVPYWHRSCDEYNGVWDDYCGSWLQATAWRGHHNSLRLGRLAMMNSQMTVRCLRASGYDRASLVDGPLSLKATIGVADPWIRTFSLGGGLASEYYSLAKEQRSRKNMDRFLRRGLEFLNVATRAGQLMPSREKSRFFAGLAAIRGHVYLELRDQTLDPVGAFEESLRIRTDSGMSGHAMGEAKADLGHVLVRHGLRARGYQLLEEGVHDLETCMGKGFAARAKLKLAECYMRRGWMCDAIRQVREADAICDLHEIERRRVTGTIPRATLWCLRVIKFSASRLCARETAAGYEYSSV